MENAKFHHLQKDEGNILLLSEKSQKYIDLKQNTQDCGNKFKQNKN